MNDETRAFMDRLLERLEARAAEVHGPEWLVLISFRAPTEDEARKIRESLSIMGRAHTVTQFERPIGAFELLRLENGKAEIVEDR